MKLRLAPNTLRFRLKKIEVRKLGRGETLRDEMIFGPGPDDRLAYELAPVGPDAAGGGCSEITASWSPGVIRVAVPAGMAEHWAGSEQVGLESAQFVDDERMLGVLIEKDFVCGPQTPDSEDRYPNPNAAC